MQGPDIQQMSCRLAFWMDSWERKQKKNEHPLLLIMDFGKEYVI